MSRPRHRSLALGCLHVMHVPAAAYVCPGRPSTLNPHAPCPAGSRRLCITRHEPLSSGQHLVLGSHGALWFMMQVMHHAIQGPSWQLKHQPQQPPPGLTTSFGCLQPHFDSPYRATCLGNFWGRRWNLTAANTLRFLVHEPILQGTPRCAARWAGAAWLWTGWCRVVK